MVEWQPIETAPRNAVSIFVHNNRAPGLPGGVADQCWSGNTAVAAWWADEGENGEWICYMSMVQDPALHFEPTHWMPLPSTPPIPQWPGPVDYAEKLDKIIELLEKIATAESTESSGNVTR